MIRDAMRTAVLALALLCALPSGADYEAGRQAWDAGRPAEALAQWRTAADTGDRRAMLALGRLYAQGLGAPQDYLEAHKWLNLAAARGVSEALKERDALAAKMTAQQVQAAQALARSWQPGDGGGSTPAQATTAAPVADADAPPPRAVREAQTLLAELGYTPGPPDGIWGQRTARAYLLFLKAAGLPSMHSAQRLTPEALRMLRAAAKGTGGDATAARAIPEASAEPAPAVVPPGSLHGAAKAGNVASLQEALSAGADVNARDGRGWTALMYAVNKGYTLLVGPLVAADADLDLRAPDGATALFIATVYGHAEIVAQLVKAGADAYIRGTKDMTPLEMAQMQGNADVVTQLQEIYARKEREEAARRAQEAISRAKSLNTLQAYEDYVSSYCPQGSFCETARNRRDGLLKAAVSSSIFRGIPEIVNSDELTLLFMPDGKLVADYRPGDRFYGTWDIAHGQVFIKRLENRALWFISWASGTAKMNGDVLVGTFEGESIPGFEILPWRDSWRLEKIKDPDERLRVEDLLKPNASSHRKDDSLDGK